jgi:hypothetical protein
MLEGLRHREVSGERVYIVVKLPDNRIRIAEHLRSQDRGWRCGGYERAWRLTSPFLLGLPAETAA